MRFNKLKSNLNKIVMSLPTWEEISSDAEMISIGETLFTNFVMAGVYLLVFLKVREHSNNDFFQRT